MIRLKLNTCSTLLLIVALIVFSACQDKPLSEEKSASGPEPAASVKTVPLFTLLTAEKTGITFSNTLKEGLNTNVMMYEYFYNGGGVAVGDLNGDGLQDIYFTANMTSNRLYLNNGDMQFKDITQQAGVAGRAGPWKTGVTMVDINGDGLLDMYVCYSGKLSEEKRKNQLFINLGPDAEGVPRFEEQAARYGLAISSTSTQAVFFDFDRDGDLDMFLLNHSPDPLPILDEASTAEMLKTVDKRNGVALFQNENNTFHDITEKAGLSNSALTYGLGAGVADINGDGWPDIYISNDYAIPDYLYINKGDGTFTDQLKASFGHTSHFSMGSDVADINNNGLPDIYTLDMLPEDNRRQKLLFAPDNYEKFDLNVKVGFGHQYMRNMLQVNNGDGTFSEAGQLAGISNTDWSWAALFADFDNDGWKDLFVSNGYLRDYTNMDFIKYMGDFVSQKGGSMKRTDVLELVHQMPASNVSNYMYKNKGNLSFEDKSTGWGINQASNSNGAVYADLDNDGDLDLIVNNINQPASVFRNESDQQLMHHYLQLKMEGEGMNTQGLGAKVTIYAKGQKQYLEQMPTRGYQSSVSPILHFGLGREETIDSLQVVWPSGKQQLIKDINANQLLSLQEKNANHAKAKIKAGVMIKTAPAKTAAPIFEEIKSPLAFRHQNTVVNDFKRQPLLVSPMSFFGPCLVKGDVNGDGLEDVYAGGGSGQTGTLYLQRKNGNFQPHTTASFEADKMSEDVDAVFFDANGDGFTDLYVSSGGYGHFMPEDPLLQDRLYLNDGKGNFTKSVTALPTMNTSSSCVRATDVDGDGHVDLFVGGRVIPGRYPEIPRSYLLINDGSGTFKDMTATAAPQLQHIGMVTDAAWHDLNGDNMKELVVVGEWMPVTIFNMVDGKLTDDTRSYFSKSYNGWWNKLLVGDFNQDNKPDLIIGNLGLNSQVKATEEQPAEMVYKDFDNNGSVDPILCFYIQGKSYPYVTRDELLDQISMMRNRFTNYESYADAGLQDIFTPEELEGAKHLSASYLKTAYFESTPGGMFQEKELPIEAQLAPVFALSMLDYNEDGKQDILIGGNINQARLRFGKSDANYGVLLQGNGKGEFSYVPQTESGLQLKGDVRSILMLDKSLLFGINQQELKAYKLK